MGTRCLTVMENNQGEEIVVMYRQMDGYPDGHGAELEKFLDGMVITNGISSLKGKTANGMDCLAAQIIAHFKVDVGNFYLYPAGTRGWGEEYIYHVRLNRVKMIPTVETIGV